MRASTGAPAAEKASPGGTKIGIVVLTGTTDPLVLATSGRRQCHIAPPRGQLERLTKVDPKQPNSSRTAPSNLFPRCRQ